MEIINKSGIYKITNKVNGKIYIGSSIKVKHRIYKEHLISLKSNRHVNNYLQNAWNKHGESNFIFEIIEYVEDNTKLIEREQYYLDTLLFANCNDNRFNELGHNICRVAGNTLGYKHSEEVKEKQSLLIKGKYIGEKNPNFAGGMKGKDNPMYGKKGNLCPHYGKHMSEEIRKNHSISAFKRVVYQYDMNWTLIREWESISEAEKELSLFHIYDCCKGNRKSCGNFKWRYKEIILNKNRKILQYNLEGNFIKEWNSLKEIKDELGLTNVYKVCKKERYSTGGFTWKYKKEN